jgi:hypothetical protein
MRLVRSCFNFVNLNRSGRISFYKLVTIFLFLNVAFKSHAQTIASPVLKNYKFTFYGGIGPNYYFNNLVMAKDYVNSYNFSFVGRIMWEPEYNLSLGIESGYYRLYSIDIDFGRSNGTVHIVNAAIPIQIVASVKFLEYYYCSFSLGQSVLKNVVRTSNYGDYDASTWSLGDYGAAIGYKHLVSDRILFGTEVKGFYSSKLNDKNIALLFMAGLRF